MGAKIKNNLSVGKIIRDWAAVITVIFLFAFFSVRMPNTFATSDNFTTIFRSIAVTTVMAMGLTMTLAMGGFDLSAGSTATMSSFIMMSFLIWHNVNVWLSILITIAGTLVITLGSMFLIVKCKIPDLLATCAMMFFLDGLSLTYSGGGAISAGMPKPDGTPSLGIVPDVLKKMGTSPTIIIIMLVAVAFVHVFLNYTKYGRYIYAVGGNKIAAKLSGIPVNKYRIIAGLMAGTFVALAGILVAARNQSAQINGASSFSMPALSAVFIGRSFAGQGKPNAVGTLIGAALVGVLDNGLVMMSVPYYSLNAIKGLVLAIALASAYYSTKED